MMCRHRRAWIAASPFPTVLPSGPSGAVPDTVTTFPARTAREIPTFGSYGLPLETSLRMIRRAYKIHGQEATMTSMAFRQISIGITAVVVLFGFAPALCAQATIKRARPEKRGHAI